MRILQGMSIRLPLLFPARYKWPAGILSFCIVATLYAATNRIAQVGQTSLFLSPFDHMIPFLPSSIWVYFSFFPFMAFALHRSRTPFGIHRAIYTFLALGIISSCLFVLFPSTFPRDGFPLPSGLDAVTSSLWDFVRTVDRPQNCLPSLHAAVSTLIISNDCHEKGKLDYPFTTWALFLIVSALTTKQHSVLDVLAGMFLAMLVHLFFGIHPKNPQSHDERIQDHSH